MHKRMHEKPKRAHSFPFTWAHLVDFLILGFLKITRIKLCLIPITTVCKKQRDIVHGEMAFFCKNMEYMEWVRALPCGGPGPVIWLVTWYSSLGRAHGFLRSGTNLSQPPVCAYICRQRTESNKMWSVPHRYVRYEDCGLGPQRKNLQNSLYSRRKVLWLFWLYLGLALLFLTYYLPGGDTEPTDDMDAKSLGNQETVELLASSHRKWTLLGSFLGQQASLCSYDVIFGSF